MEIEERQTIDENSPKQFPESLGDHKNDNDFREKYDEKSMA